MIEWLYGLSLYIFFFALLLYFIKHSLLLYEHFFHYHKVLMKVY